MNTPLSLKIFGISLLLIGSFSLNNCTVYRPQANTLQQTHSGASVVTPSWNGRVTFWGKAWPLIVGPLVASAAGVIYYQRSPTAFANQTTGERPSLGTTAITMALAGIIVPGMVPLSYLRKKSATVRRYDPSQADNWTRKLDGRWDVYKTLPNNALLIGPRGGLATYLAEEKAIADRAEKERLAAIERVRQAEIARELAAYEAFRKLGKWADYLDAYPSGLHSEEVRREGERLAYEEVKRAERRAGTTYIKYFYPGGEHSALVREVSDEFQEKEILWDDYYKTDSYDGYKQLLDRIATYRELMSKRRADIPAEKRELQQLYGGLIESADLLTKRTERYFKGKASDRAARQEAAATWVVGDNLCWKPGSHSLDEEGKKIPGTDAETAIRVTIEEINPDRTRFKIRVKELFNTRKNRNASSFRMSDSNRIWELEELDWIDPLSEDMNFKKCL
ncbi:hypothetical protein [Fibrella aquatilis]|uniref:Uncharacterized protein n=1 Tax=Fibrella aquatilis TaxID=2817059 RepID=A0A939G8I9_9BACT|nr:hypothetical protein [Fibrella aquatilis]MBO0933826.1 hypothetical protein [Fibrella aquatilis]